MIIVLPIIEMNSKFDRMFTPTPHWIPCRQMIMRPRIQRYSGATAYTRTFCPEIIAIVNNFAILVFVQRDTISENGQCSDFFK